MDYQSMQIGGRPIYFREGTSDTTILHVNFLGGRREYQFPETEPRIILDIGANTGIVTVLLSRLYPRAIIHAFEPQQENFKILELNTKPYANVHRHRYALGDKTGKAKLFPSADPVNCGGFSLFETGCDAQRSEQVEVLEVNEAMRWIGCQGADLIKIDCEGAEYDILMGMEILAGSKWIVGELHGNRDYELLGFLSHGFDLGLRKDLDTRTMHFTARKK